MQPQEDPADGVTLYGVARGTCPVPSVLAPWTRGEPRGRGLVCKLVITTVRSQYGVDDAISVLFWFLVCCFLFCLPGGPLMRRLCVDYAADSA